MLSYRAIMEFLGGAAHQAQIAALYRELTEGAEPLPVARMLVAILDSIEEADLFPVHASDEHEIADDVASGSVPPFQWFVHFEGLDLDDEWEFYDEAVHLVMALMEGCSNGEAFEHVYSEEARAWWTEREAEYDLPDLDELDGERVVANLKALDQEPWSGLWAIWRWIEGGTGNWFVDIPCSCAGECELDIDWCIADVRMLQREYDAAGQIFEPFAELVDLCRRAPAATLGHCFDLALEGSERAAAGSEFDQLIQKGEYEEADWEEMSL